MASQAERDTAAAKAKQGGGQAAKDTASAKAKQNNNNQAAKDTARAKSRQNGGDGGTSDDFAARESANGLSNTTSGFGGSAPSFAQREAANGLSNTTSGRDDFYAYKGQTGRSPDGQTDYGVYDIDPPVSFPDLERPPRRPLVLYAFKVINDGDGTVSVTTGTVNTETATSLTPGGKPTELWLDVTFDTDGDVTAASVVTSSGSTTATSDYRQVATITWDGNTPTIVQGIKGSQSIASCGSTHQWGTLYS
jgi:hypothetical protein